MGLEASFLLPSSGSGKGLASDLSGLFSKVYSESFELDRIKPLLLAALGDAPGAKFWEEVYRIVALPAVEPRQPLSRFPYSFQ